jgi:hypothetical protein
MAVLGKDMALAEEYVTEGGKEERVFFSLVLVRCVLI